MEFFKGIIISIFTLVTILCFGKVANAQEISDSLLHELKDANSEDSLVIIEQLFHALPEDSLDLNQALCKRAIDIAHVLSDFDNKATFQNLNGICLARQNKYQEADLNYHHSLNTSYLVEDPNLIGQALYSIGNNHIILGNYDSAMYFLDSANTLLDEINKGHLLHYLINDRIGTCLKFKAEYYKALAYYNKILEKALYRDSMTKAITLKNISSVYIRLDEYSKALEIQFDALEIYKSIASKIDMSILLNEIGITYKRLNHLDKALEYFEQSLQLKLDLNNLVGVSASYLNIGSIHNKQGNYGLALNYFNKSLSLKEKISTTKGVAALYINIGLVYKRTKEYDKALVYYRKAIGEAKARGSRSYELNALNNLTSLYLEYPDYNKAIKYGNMTLDLAIELGSKSWISTAYYNLAEAFQLNKQFDKAYTHFIEFKKYEDSLNTQETEAKIAQLETRYQLVQKENELEVKSKELALLKAEQDLKDSRIKLLLAGFALSLLILIISIWIYRNKNLLKIKRLLSQNKHLSIVQDLVEEKLKNEKVNKEHYKLQLLNLTQQLIKKNDQLEQLQKDNDRLKTQLVSVKSKEHHGVVETIMQSGQSKKDWGLFMEYFQNVYHDFLDRLKLQYDQLTTNELRLCALIRINLTSKEIASVMNITVPSLRTSKYRLRKKLQLTNDQSVEDFLLKF